MTEAKPGNHVAVIGLGNMGSALAHALPARGHDVIVWNRSASKAEPLMAAGAAVAGSAAEAAAAANVVIVCVIDHQSSLSVLQTEVVAGALRGKLLVQLSTVTAEESRELGRWAEGNGIAYLDGAILGYPEDVREQACTIVYSGPKSDFEANKDVLVALGAIRSTWAKPSEAPPSSTRRSMPTTTARCSPSFTAPRCATLPASPSNSMSSASWSEGHDKRPGVPR